MIMKVHVNVGTIDHVDHGKTTLTSAISHVQSVRTGGKALSFAQIDNFGTVVPEVSYLIIWMVNRIR